jgi:hypothetical protein
MAATKPGAHPPHGAAPYFRCLDQDMCTSAVVPSGAAVGVCVRLTTGVLTHGRLQRPLQPATNCTDHIFKPRLQHHNVVAVLVLPCVLKCAAFSCRAWCKHYTNTSLWHNAGLPTRLQQFTHKLRQLITALLVCCFGVHRILRSSAGCLNVTPCTTSFLGPHLPITSVAALLSA